MSGNASKVPTSADDEFFVGYLPMPEKTRRFTNIVTITLVVLLLGVGVAAAFFQGTPGKLLDESQAGSGSSGVLFTTPYPYVLVQEEAGPARAVILVGAGKSGADAGALVSGTAVSVSGNLLSRAASRMLEGPTVSERPSTPADDALRNTPRESLGDVVLEGEIVDTKCYLGRMKPGAGRVHRACAQLCIAGGVAPILTVITKEGGEVHYLLASKSDGPVNDQVIPFVAEPVRVKGALSRHGTLLILQIDPAEITRL